MDLSLCPTHHRPQFSLPSHGLFKVVGSFIALAAVMRPQNALEMFTRVADKRKTTTISESLYGTAVVCEIAPAIGATKFSRSPIESAIGLRNSNNVAITADLRSTSRIRQNICNTALQRYGALAARFLSILPFVLVHCCPRQDGRKSAVVESRSVVG